jgi:hypothetical protein
MLVNTQKEVQPRDSLKTSTAGAFLFKSHPHSIRERLSPWNRSWQMLEQESCQLFTEHKEMKKGIPLIFFLPKTRMFHVEQEVRGEVSLNARGEKGSQFCKHIDLSDLCRHFCLQWPSLSLED